MCQWHFGISYPRHLVLISIIGVLHVSLEDEKHPSRDGNMMPVEVWDEVVSRRTRKGTHQRPG